MKIVERPLTDAEKEANRELERHNITLPPEYIITFENREEAEKFVDFIQTLMADGAVV